MLIQGPSVLVYYIVFHSKHNYGNNNENNK